MAENYNLGSKFGFNIAPKHQKFLNPQKLDTDISATVETFLNSITSYINTYEDVFNGNVANEINMYSRQSMIVGMNLRAAETKRNFDINI